MSPSPTNGPPAPETSPIRRTRARRWRRTRARLRLFRRRMHTHPALHLPWRVLVGTVGAVVVLAGLLMMVVPGPGLASVVLGLVILSTEFRWARKVVRPAQVWFHRAERYGMRLREEFFRRLRERRTARRRRPLPDTTSD
ncbi:hypothetical protein CQJ94_26890 [Glycomyces fuscus]|nr:hypothetical protein CQJ94_26890 [Glycomyces fuscus]